MAHDPNSKQDTTIGIDLGTTNPCVAVWKDGHIEIVTFTDNEELVDDDAMSPESTVYDANYIIERGFDDLPFKVTNSVDEPKISVPGGKKTEPMDSEEVSALIYGYMRDISKEYLRKTVTHDLMTVSDYFSDAQCQATKEGC